MTTTPTPELPDLDRLEALADAVPEHLRLNGWYVAAPSFGQQHVYADNFKGQGRQHIASLPAHKTYFAGLAEFIAAFNPPTIKQLIALARRAQPEGEAPQAEPVAKVTCPGCHGIGTWIGQHDGYDDADCHMCDGAGKIAALAAQSQGAQAAPRDVKLAIEDMHRVVNDTAVSLRNYGRMAMASRLEDVAVSVDRIASAALAAKAEAAALTPLDYRAQGREEALAIILAESAEDPFSECTGWSKSGAPDDEGGAYWKEGELRALLHIDDRKHDAYDRAEAAYWEALGRKDEAARELLFAQQAPFYKPLHDFLSKHEAWNLMADLKRAQQAAAPGAIPDHWKSKAEWITRGRDLGAEERGRLAVMLLRTLLAAVSSAPGTPEAPQTAAARDVLAERQRQMEVEGWTPAHDDKYRENELPRAASAYTLGGHYISPPAIWPWAGSWWKPRDARANYVRASALLIAEIERLDRAAKLDGGQEVKHG